MNKKNAAALIISLVTFAFGAVCYFILPDTVVVQWAASGTPNTLPKIAAILVSYAVTALLIFLSYGKEKKSYLGMSLLGIVMQVLFVVMN